MEVLLHAGTSISGWRTAQIHDAILAAFGVKASNYTLTQLRYDIRKMKAHGLIERDGKRYAYRPPPKAIRSRCCSCSFTNVFAGRSPTVCSTRRRKCNPNRPPRSRRHIAKLTNQFNRFSIFSPLNNVREKSSDQKLKNLSDSGSQFWDTDKEVIQLCPLITK